MTQSQRLFRVPTILVLAVLTACPYAGQTQESVQEQGEKFNTLLYYMNRMYVDSVDLDGLVETAIRGMLEELDPHSVYIPAEDLQQADEPLNGKFEGIGVRFNIMKDTIMGSPPSPVAPAKSWASCRATGLWRWTARPWRESASATRA